jgi:hypothetical protein
MQRKTSPVNDPTAATPQRAGQQLPTMLERLSAIQADFQALKRPGGQPADKQWFDDIWE